MIATACQTVKLHSIDLHLLNEPIPPAGRGALGLLPGDEVTRELLVRAGIRISPPTGTDPKYEAVARR